MAEVGNTPIVSRVQSRFHMDWAIEAILKPTRTLEKIVSDGKANWLTPLLILSVAAILGVLVAAPMKPTSTGGEASSLPPEYQYYSPEQLAQIEQANTVANGPVFRYVFPIGLSVAKVWLGWLIVGASLHLILTLIGGRSSSSAMMNMVAWAGLPFAIREIVRIFYMLVTKGLIQSPGLSGFAPQDGGTAGLILVQLLRLNDVYWIWHVILLVIGVRAQKGLTPVKVAWSVVVIQVLALIVQVIPGVLSAQFAQLNIIRPFFF